MGRGANVVLVGMVVVLCHPQLLFLQEIFSDPKWVVRYGCRHWGTSASKLDCREVCGCRFPKWMGRVAVPTIGRLVSVRVSLASLVGSLVAHFSYTCHHPGWKPRAFLGLDCLSWIISDLLEENCHAHSGLGTWKNPRREISPGSTPVGQRGVCVSGDLGRKFMRASIPQLPSNYKLT